MSSATSRQYFLDKVYSWATCDDFSRVLCYHSFFAAFPLIVESSLGFLFFVTIIIFSAGIVCFQKEQKEGERAEGWPCSCYLICPRHCYGRSLPYAAGITRNKALTPAQKGGTVT